MSELTVRELRDKLNAIPEDQLDNPVGVDWEDSHQSSEAKSVTVTDGYVTITA